MDKYHKIQSIYKRDDKGAFLVGEYSCPEFYYLADNIWEFTEKIDGTNIRIGYENGKLVIGGRSERSQMPTFLYDKLTEIFADYDNEEMALYGEGYGARIQKGGEGYIAEGVGFILFDVKVGPWWLRREDVEKVADEHHIPVVPIVGLGTLKEACALCETSFASQVGNRSAEGLVMKPRVPLYARNGDRIITKVKVRDFQ